MAFIQNTITDLDDLLIQVDRINGNGTTITVDTIDDHGLIATDIVEISGTSNFNGVWTLVSGSGSVFTITDTLNPGIEGAIDGTSVGQVINSEGSGVYSTPEISIDAVNKTISLLQAGSLATLGSGVTGQALYSLFKERWKSVQGLTQFDFPMVSITNEQFEFAAGWVPLNDLTRKMIRTAGWAEVNATGTTLNKYAGVISLGSLANTDQPYFVQEGSFSATSINTDFEGPVNEAVQIFLQTPPSATSDLTITATTITSAASFDFVALGFQIGDTLLFAGSTGNDAVTNFKLTNVTSTVLTGNSVLIAAAPDTAAVTLSTDRSANFKLLVRTRGSTYADSNLTDIGVTTMTTIVYRFPVSNGNDLNINTVSDNAFTGAAIASIAADGTTVTATCSVPHGLYSGAPITISGTTSYNGTFTVSAISGLDVSWLAATSVGTETGIAKLGYVDLILIDYMPNPDTTTGDINIRGVYEQGPSVAYLLGDVVSDGTDWFFLDVETGTAGTAATLATDTTGVTWTSYTQSVRDIEENSTNSVYSVVYEMNNNVGTPGATKEVAYEFAQYSLRLAADINDSSVGTSTPRFGNIADPLVSFIGSQLHTFADIAVPFAVVLDDIGSADVNSVTYHDYADATHTAPIVVLVTINFNGNLSGDNDAVFYAYYTGGTASFGEAAAVQVVQSNATNVGVDESNNVPDGGVYTFNYAYDADTTNGRAISTDTNITVVSIGLDTGQYVSATGDIKVTGATFSLVAPLERNYLNN